MQGSKCKHTWQFMFILLTDTHRTVEMSFWDDFIGQSGTSDSQPGQFQQRTTHRDTLACRWSPNAAVVNWKRMKGRWPDSCSSSTHVTQHRKNFQCLKYPCLRCPLTRNPKVSWNIVKHYQNLYFFILVVSKLRHVRTINKTSTLRTQIWVATLKN